MGRSIRNKPKSKSGGVGGGVSTAQLQTKADTSTVSSLQTSVDAQLQTKADVTTVSALETTVNSLSVVEANPTASGTSDLTKLTVGSITYGIPTNAYIHLYKTSNSSSYYSSNPSHYYGFWDAYTSSHNNMSMDSSNNVSVPQGTYLALFHLAISRNNGVNSSWYYINIGIQNSAGTNFINISDDNGKEAGLNSGRSPSGNVYIQKIITLNTNDTLQFYHKIRYLHTTVRSTSCASLIKIA